MALTGDWSWQRACLWSAWIVLATRSAQLSILSVLRFCFYMKGSFLNNSSLLIVFSIHNSYWILWIMQIYLWLLPALLRCCCVELLKGSWHNTQDTSKNRWWRKDVSKEISCLKETFFKLSRDLSLSLSYKWHYTFPKRKDYLQG